MLLTKYRCGAHVLKIKTGYSGQIPEQYRLCACKNIQTLEHVLFECPITAAIRPLQSDSLEAFFSDANAVSKLKMLEMIFNLRRW